jgi:hypothetical protein
MLLLSLGTLEHGMIEARGCRLLTNNKPGKAIEHDRQAHNLKVRGSNPLPATK